MHVLVLHTQNVNELVKLLSFPLFLGFCSCFGLDADIEDN